MQEHTARDSDRRHVSIDHHDGSPLMPDDPRVAYLRAVQTARAVVAAVTAGDSARRTPCSDWAVADLVDHMVAVARRVASAPSGADISGAPAMPAIELDVATAEIDQAMRDSHDAWTDEALAMTLDAPWGPTPGAACLGIWASELLAHSWDLAVSIGVTVDWPEPDVSIAAEHVRDGIPAERNADAPFDPVVEVGADADPIVKLVAWIGRDPRNPIRV